MKNILLSSLTIALISSTLLIGQNHFDHPYLNDCAIASHKLESAMNKAVLHTTTYPGERKHSEQTYNEEILPKIVDELHTKYRASANQEDKRECINKLILLFGGYINLNDASDGSTSVKIELSNKADNPNNTN